MDDFMLWMFGFIIISLLFAILNKDKKKPTAKELKKIRENQQIIWFYIKGFIAIMLLFLVIWYILSLIGSG